LQYSAETYKKKTQWQIKSNESIGSLDQAFSDELGKLSRSVLLYLI